MVVTEDGKRFTALLLGGSSTNIPVYMGIGSGSGAALASVGSLFAEYDGKRETFLSTDNSTAKKIIWDANWGLSSISGLTINEFSLNTGSPSFAKDLWNYENLGTGVLFDGETELRILTEWTVS